MVQILLKLICKFQRHFNVTHKKTLSKLKPGNLFMARVVSSMLQTSISISSCSRTLLDIALAASTSNKRDIYQAFITISMIEKYSLKRNIVPYAWVIILILFLTMYIMFGFLHFTQYHVSLHHIVELTRYSKRHRDSELL